jgi:hypothetical protein
LCGIIIDRLSDDLYPFGHRGIKEVKMPLEVRRQITIVDDKFEEAGIRHDTPLRKVAIVSVLKNPLAGKYQADLSDMMAESVALGEKMAERAVAALGTYSAQGYGKGGIVGLSGEREHAISLITTIFANPIRDAIGGGKAWISSVTKLAAPGALIAIPMNHKDDFYVRSHYDTMSLVLPDAPMPDELAIIFCLVSGARLNARVGGLTHEEVMGR